jgi:hypothetical protein
MFWSQRLSLNDVVEVFRRRNREETRMNAIQGTWRNGHVVLDAPAGWPEECRVLVEPVASQEKIGLTEDEWSDAPQAIEDWIRWYDSLEPLELTPSEEAEIAAWRRQVKEYTVAKTRQSWEADE